MAETKVKQEICKTCGTDVRPQSLFCYSCGSSVSAESNKPQAAEVLPGKNISEEKQPAAKTEVIQLEKKEVVQETAQNKDGKELKTKNIQEDAKLKSAAAMRRKAKSIEKKQIEVVWEEPASAWNIRLILATLLLLAFAGAIVTVAFYLK